MGGGSEPVYEDCDSSEIILYSFAEDGVAPNPVRIGVEPIDVYPVDIANGNTPISDFEASIDDETVATVAISTSPYDPTNIPVAMITSAGVPDKTAVVTITIPSKGCKILCPIETYLSD